MTGGPSQTDTFDPKPGHPNGGEFKAIETAVPGIVDQRAPAQAGQADERHRHHPLDEHEGRGPRPRDLQPADRLPADRPDPLPDPGLARRQGARRATTPSCPTSSASRRSAPSTPARSDRASSGRSMPRWSSASVPVIDPQGGYRRANLSFKVEDLSLPPGVDNHAGRCPARLARLVAQGLPVQPSRDRPRRATRTPTCEPSG